MWVEAFSRDYGRVALLARSARKRLSELRGVLVPFVPLKASWFGEQELRTLHRAEWLGGWPQPQGKALLSALYVNELVLRLTAREDAHPHLFDALAEVMRALACEEHHAARLRLFEWQLLTELGFAADISQDAQGQPLLADAWYWMQVEAAPQRLSQAPDSELATGVAVRGSTLQQMHTGQLAGEAALQEALKLNRMLLDFRLPEIHSRRIARQLQQWPASVPLATPG